MVEGPRLTNLASDNGEIDEHRNVRTLDDGGKYVEYTYTGCWTAELPGGGRVAFRDVPLAPHGNRIPLLGEVLGQ
jgi:hypothetical protein